LEIVTAGGARLGLARSFSGQDMVRFFARVKHRTGKEGLLRATIVDKESRRIRPFESSATPFSCSTSTEQLSARTSSASSNRSWSSIKRGGVGSTIFLFLSERPDYNGFIPPAGKA